MPNYFAPEVYIEEFEPAAPIVGVGTSTAALLGPSRTGPLNLPTKLTSWEQFMQQFGNKPLEGFNLWYAARGFFENGGRTCYVTRVSNATYGTLTLNDIAAQPTLIIRARQAGTINPALQVQVDADVHSVPKATAKLFRPTGVIAAAAQNTKTITLTTASDAERFRPGDRITWNGIAEPGNAVLISGVSGASIEIVTPLTQNYGAGNVRLDNPKPGADTLRLEAADKVAPGMVLTLEQTAPAMVSETVTVKSVIVERINAALTTHRVTLRTPLTKTYDFAGGAVSVQSHEFTLTIKAAGQPDNVYAELGMDAEHPRYYANVMRDEPYVDVQPIDPPNITAPPGNRPATLAATAIPDGNPDTPASLSSAEYKAALKQLEATDDVNLIVIPDRQDADVQLAMIAQCEALLDRFAILDSASGAPPFGAGSVDVQRQGLTGGGRGYAALYYPWLKTMSADGTRTIHVPPSGHIAGIYARTDQHRGVHKAPAGLEASVRGALGVERLLTHADQEQLNPNGINVLRIFGGGRPIVWGARTTASGYGGNANWQYVNVRRLFLYLEESIQEGLRGSVFEPNNPSLWQKLKRTLTGFLERSWREGAFFGEKPSRAFYVRIDEELNPFSEQQLGRLHIEIGVRPSYPAEFIIVRIGIWDGGSEVSES